MGSIVDFLILAFVFFCILFVLIGVPFIIFSKRRKQDFGSVKLNTQSEFYHIISQFGVDEAHHEMIVFNKDTSSDRRKMVLRKYKNGLGMAMFIYDKADLLISQTDNVSVNESALVFFEFFNPQRHSIKYVDKKNKVKKKPIVYR